MSGADVSIPPGWYPDPEVPGGQRWWSGIGWTDYRKAPAEVAASVSAWVTPPAARPNVGYPGALVGPVPVIDPVTGEAPLWAPLYGATFGQAWTRLWRKFADFSGRASRSEFWLGYVAWFLLWFSAQLVIGIVMGVGFVVASDDRAALAGIISTLLGLVLVAGFIVTLIPLLSCSVRRLHDAGYPGTYCLLGFVPIAGPILLLVYLASDSDPAGAVHDRPTA